VSRAQLGAVMMITGGGTGGPVLGLLADGAVRTLAVSVVTLAAVVGVDVRGMEVVVKPLGVYGTAAATRNVS